MLEKDLLRLASVLICGVGMYLCLRPASVADKIKSFYSRYPIIRYAGEKQLTSRSAFVRLVGVVLIIVGIICLLSVPGRGWVNSIFC
jgi:hypothetical protein